MKKTTLILMVLLVIILLISGCGVGPKMVKNGEISDLRLSSGGFMADDLTHLIFTDGTSLVLIGLHPEFIIGHHYTIEYRETGDATQKHKIFYLTNSEEVK